MFIIYTKVCPLRFSNIVSRTIFDIDRSSPPKVFCKRRVLFHRTPPVATST